VPLGETTAPSGLEAKENRAFEANIRENIKDKIFYISERNDGHENRFCRTGYYNPNEQRPSTGKELWRRLQFVYSGNARQPFWIVRVPKDIIWGHRGLWNDNSVAMLAALFRMQFPLAEASVCGLRNQGLSLTGTLLSWSAKSCEKPLNESAAEYSTLPWFLLRFRYLSRT
jgi:hypothetical protein